MSETGRTTVREVGGLHELVGPIPTGSLCNEDLAPTAVAARSWGTWNIAALWVALVVCVPTYMLAGSLIQMGMNWWQAILTITLGNVVVLIPMVLNAHAGTKYGVPFPVLIRASFGTWGANLPSILRGLVACGWFGIQTWVGGAALYACWVILRGGGTPEVAPSAGGPALGEFVAFGVFWLMNMYFIWRGTESIKWLETLAAPFLIVCGFALLGWAWVQVGSLGAMLAPPEVGGAASRPFAAVFWPGLTAMVGFWATLSLNIPDFTRYARSQRDQLLGQAIGLPTTMALFSFIGLAVTGATIVLYGKAIWDPVQLVRRMHESGAGGVGVTFVAMLFLAIATLSTNIAANVVAPANALTNLCPRLVSFRMGGLMTGIIGIVMMPWKILASSGGYIYSWLIGYSALLGPIAGVMIADYYVVRGGRLDLLGLYREDGPYRYRSGTNWMAVVALLLGILPNLPGFLVTVGAVDDAAVPAVFQTIFGSAWFVGFVVAFVVYAVGMRIVGQKS